MISNTSLDIIMLKCVFESHSRCNISLLCINSMTMVPTNKNFTTYVHPPPVLPPIADDYILRWEVAKQINKIYDR